MAPSYRKLCTKVLKVALIFSCIWLSWLSLQLVTGTDTPIIVEIAGGNQPAFNERGDLLFLYNDGAYKVGDVVALKVRAIPIVHRIIEIHEWHNGTLQILTKGDVNSVPDSFGLYKQGQSFIGEEEISGKVAGYIPYLGSLFIIAKDLNLFVPLGIVFIFTQLRK